MSFSRCVFPPWTHRKNSIFTGPVALLDGVSRFVPSLVRIDPDAVETPIDDSSSPAALYGVRSGRGGREKDMGLERRKNLGWREFKSFACAAGVDSVEAPAITAQPSLLS